MAMAKQVGELRVLIERSPQPLAENFYHNGNDHSRPLYNCSRCVVDALLAELEKERAAAAYWRGLLADTAAGLRTQNLSPRTAAGAIERAMDAARSLESLRQCPPRGLGQR